MQKISNRFNPCNSKPLLAYFITLLFLCNAALAQTSQAHNYSTTYKEQTVGKATLNDVIQILGEPQSKQINSNNIRYVFPNEDVTIQNSTTRINTIIIHDSSYTDINGHSIGTDYATIKNNQNIIKSSSTLFDTSNGIFYWFKQGKVEKIVYVATAEF